MCNLSPSSLLRIRASGSVSLYVDRLHEPLQLHRSLLGLLVMELRVHQGRMKGVAS